MAQRIQRPLKAFFVTNFRPTLEEARKVYSFFAAKGELIEFKFARDPEIKKIKNFGWISYKDDKITEELFENWFKIEPYNTEVIVQRADKEVKKSKTQQLRASKYPMFGGFYLKDDAPSSSPVLDQINDKLTSISEINDKSQLYSSDTGQESGNVIIKESNEAIKDHQDSSSTATANFTETVIEDSTKTIETNVYRVVNSESNAANAAQNPSENL
ncbi:7529_t:CDS:2 [Funneliformis mosseae]|uniref:7529_t:CDS:1 n=1 Tax=Funneliformis mosseae TaxID=27381 RepID=A0A9N9CWF8_FUNMO|nr:7529_t:CDS:2 [Funneliformis mosseae]